MGFGSQCAQQRHGRAADAGQCVGPDERAHSQRVLLLHPAPHPSRGHQATLGSLASQLCCGLASQLCGLSSNDGDSSGGDSSGGESSGGCAESGVAAFRRTLLPSRDPFGRSLVEDRAHRLRNRLRGHTLM